MLKLYQKTTKPSRQPGNIFPRVKEKSHNVLADSLDETMPNNIDERCLPPDSPRNLLTNEENLLEQTMGQTLTQQKQILDQINTQTRNRNHMQLMNRYLIDVTENGE